jgi:hypothetical protein
MLHRLLHVQTFSSSKTKPRPDLVHSKVQLQKAGEQLQACTLQAATHQQQL